MRMNKISNVKEVINIPMFKLASIYKCNDRVYDDANRIEKYSSEKHDDLIVVGHTFIGDTLVLQVKEYYIVTYLYNKETNDWKSTRFTDKEKAIDNYNRMKELHDIVYFK
jgi:aspartokinase